MVRARACALYNTIFAIFHLYDLGYHNMKHAFVENRPALIYIVHERICYFKFPVRISIGEVFLINHEKVELKLFLKEDKIT